MTIGKMIFKYRQAWGMTQMDLSHRCGISQAAIARYEAGLRNPKAYNLDTIADVLEMNRVCVMILAGHRRGDRESAINQLEKGLDNI